MQDLADARHPSMPESAINHVEVDAVLPVDKMPRFLEDALREKLPLKEEKQLSEDQSIEVKIAMEGNALQHGIMEFGEVSSNTCPECHGVLVRIREGTIVRYRCHTGYAYSLQALLSDVNKEIDETLWNALRAMEERILLLEELAEHSSQHGTSGEFKPSADLVRGAGDHAEVLRKLVLSHSLFGQKSNRSPENNP